MDWMVIALVTAMERILAEHDLVERTAFVEHVNERIWLAGTLSEVRRVRVAE